MHRTRPSARRVYLATCFIGSLLLGMLGIVSSVYAVKVAHLTPLQLVLVGTTLEATALFLQVPTGVVADVFSRRLSVIIGYLLTGFGLLRWGAFARFETILLAQVLWGTGYTFIIGAKEAWIADEAGESEAGHLFLRGAQAGQAGAILGILASAVLASIRLNLPIVTAGGLYLVLALTLIPLMPETRKAPVRRASESTLQHLGRAVTTSVRVVRRSSVLLTILGISAVLGAASEGYDRLRDAHIIEEVGVPSLGRFDPVVWFAVLGIGGALMSFVAAEVVRRRLDTNSHKAVARTLLSFNALLVLAVVAFGLSGNFALALATAWAVTLLRRTNDPLTTAWLNQNLEPDVRATVFSMNSQADALGQITAGPFLGAIASLVSIRAGIVVAGGVISPSLLLYGYTLRKHGTQTLGVVPEASPTE
jgi:DHA3 family tetracycline resistance protein-like MFS transporter